MKLAEACLREAEPLYESSPLHFVKADATILYGDEELERFLDTGHEPDEAPELGGLLIDQDFQPTTSSYDIRLDILRWNKKQHIRHGQWLLELINKASDQPVDLTTKLIKKSYFCGVGASLFRLTEPELFASVFEFHQAIEAKPRYRRNAYDHWGWDDFADYVEESLRLKPDDMNMYDWIRYRAHHDEGPSKGVMSKRGITVSQILEERCGHFDVRNWKSRPPYSNWGALFMLANDGQLPRFYSGAIRYLPSEHSITWTTMAKYFNGVEDFHAASIKRYEVLSQQLEEQIAKLERLVPAYSNPVRDVLDSSEPLPTRVQIGSQYVLVKRLNLPGSEPQHQELATLPSPHELSEAVQVRYGRRTKHLRISARQLGIYDNIWTLHDRMQQLRLRPPA